MCPHLRSAESRLRRRTMKRPNRLESPHHGRLALSVANRGLRCEFFSAGAEVGKVFARAEIRKAAREVMSSSATNAPRSPRRSLRGLSLSPRNLTRPEILLPPSERRFISGAFLTPALRTIAIPVVGRWLPEHAAVFPNRRSTFRIPGNTSTLKDLNFRDAFWVINPANNDEQSFFEDVKRLFCQNVKR